MINFPNCKINIGLFITEKRPDGFHALESIFLPVPLCDALEIIPNQTKTATLQVLGLNIEGANTDNIVYKAWQLLRDKYSIGGVDIALIKKIPTGAGLGGGSSDAAFALRMLNNIFALQLSTEQLEQHAAQLGSDCPFFIQNAPCFVSGRGDILEPIDINLKGYHIHIIHPGIHISTPKAFSLITPKPTLVDLHSLAQIPVIDWRETVVNDFESPIFELHPVLSNIKQTLYQNGALYASMSGSGSAVYGIFKEEKKMTFDDQFFHWSGQL